MEEQGLMIIRKKKTEQLCCNEHQYVDIYRERKTVKIMNTLREKEIDYC